MATLTGSDRERGGGGGDVKTARSAATTPLLTTRSKVAPVAEFAVTVMTDEVLEISNRIRQALECPVCLELNVDVMCNCPNGHLVCGTCLKKLRMWSTTNRCPMCRSPMSTLTGGPVTAQRLLMTMQLVNVACIHWQHGCRKLIRIADVDSHQVRCDHCPDIRCLVITCPWLGAYELLYHHVCQEHPEAVVSTEDNRLTVTDAGEIKLNRRRVYLVTADRGSTLMWVLMIRKSRTHIQTGVFVVDPVPGRPPWTDMGYRLTYPAVGGCKKQSVTRWVGRWKSSLDVDSRNDNSAESPYTTFRSRTGCAELHWFKHSTGRCMRNAADSCVRVMDVVR